VVDDEVNAVLHGSIGEKVSLGAPGMWKHAADDWDRVRLKLDEAIAKQARRRQ
jgi:hypothetical protein